jgi:uncharacterized alpha-E superfamily protein
VHRVTAATQAVRDQLSPDTWLVLGTLDAALRELEAGPSNDVLIGQTLNRALSSLLALAGLAAESMVRDLGWRFLEAGRRIERAQQVVALLRAALLEERPVEVDSLVMESVLVAAESIITYRRRYAPRAEVATVLELLLSDRGNPRSLVHQLDRLAANLSQLPHSDVLRAEVDELAALVRTASASALTRRVDHESRRPDLGAFLGELDTRLRSLGRVVERTWFEDVLAPVPLAEVIS